MDIGSVSPVPLGNGLVYQAGKNGQGYLLNASNLGGVGGSAGRQVYTAAVCPSGQEAIGGTAVVGPIVYQPCTSTLVAVHTSSSAFSVSHVREGLSGDPGPGSPILAGGALWMVETGASAVYALDPASGQVLFRAVLSGTFAHFAAPASGANHVYAASGSTLSAFLLSSVAATDTPTPSATETPSPTSTSTPTDTPLPTVTPTVTSPGTPSPTPTSPAVLPCTTQVAVAALTNNNGYYVIFDTAAAGPISATWSIPANNTIELDMYAGNPFSGQANPAKAQPPQEALASMSGNVPSLTLATGPQPAGIYTVYFFNRGNRVPAARGTLRTLGLVAGCGVTARVLTPTGGAPTVIVEPLRPGRVTTAAGASRSRGIEIPLTG